MNDLAVRTGEIVVGSVELITRRPPHEVLAEAQTAAAALKGVLESKPKKVVFNGEQYLEFEDWQTIARFYGITAKVVSTAFVAYGDVKGFSARAVALRADGAEISAAESECLNDEDKWRSKSKYEWRDGQNGREKVKVGDEPVPLFQLKSMAQTRACAKALRNVLSWVVVLAGYRSTPAEELPTDRVDTHDAPASSAPKSAAPASADGRTKVKSVAVKTGENKRGKWTRFDVTFEDGRRAGTFHESIGKHAQHAMDSGAQVIPIIEHGEKGDTLVEFRDLSAATPSTAAAAAPPDEPVNGPETILTARKADTPNGPRWIIQTSKRQVIATDEVLANQATEARKAKQGLIPVFEVVPVEKGGSFNRLINWTIPDVEGATK